MKIYDEARVKMKLSINILKRNICVIVRPQNNLKVLT